MYRCLFCLTLALLTVCGQALAVDVPSSASVGPVPATPGDGLNGRYWQLPPDTMGGDAVPADALVSVGGPIMSSTPPTATFISTGLNYTGDDLTPIGTWLAADAASLVGGDPATNNLDDGLFSFNGYLAVPAAGTMDFRISSDDGSILNIGGVTVVSNDGGHGTPGNAPNGSATFTAAGLYPMEVTYFNGDWTDAAGAHGGASIAWRAGTTDASPLVSKDVLYTVPEPASMALVGLGSLAALLLIRRRVK
jgi:hypothetical protein